MACVLGRLFSKREAGEKDEVGSLPSGSFGGGQDRTCLSELEKRREESDTRATGFGNGWRRSSPPAQPMAFSPSTGDHVLLVGCSHRLGF